VPPDSTPIKWGFSTLGCHELTLEQALALARSHAISFIELRALADRLDLPAYLKEECGTLANASRLAEEYDVRIVGLDAGFKLCASSEDDRKEIEEFAEAAQVLNAPYIRVFGGAESSELLTDAEIEIAQRHFDWWRDLKLRRGWHCDLLLETHDSFASSGNCERLLDELT